MLREVFEGARCEGHTDEGQERRGAVVVGVADRLPAMVLRRLGRDDGTHVIEKLRTYLGRPNPKEDLDELADL